MTTVDLRVMRTVDLTVDRKRLHASSTRLKTGIRVHAKCGERVGAFCIEVLDRDSLSRWLRSDGGKNDLAESVVLALLKYDRLTDEAAKLERLPPTLDRPSLLRWLRSDGGKNELAENIVLALLGHDRLTAGGASV